MKAGHKIYELTEVGLSNGEPIFITATSPKAAVVEEFGPVRYVEGTLVDGDGPIRFASSLLDADREIYIDVREVDASTLGSSERYRADPIDIDAMLAEIANEEPDSLGG